MINIFRKRTHKVSDVFEREPNKWSFRGDQVFWEYLKQYYSNKVFPYDKEIMIKEIYELFEKLSKEKLEPNKVVYVEEFDKGGMSSGKIDTTWWIEVGIPCIIKNYDKLKNHK